MAMAAVAIVVLAAVTAVAVSSPARDGSWPLQLEAGPKELKETKCLRYDTIPSWLQALRQT